MKSIISTTFTLTYFEAKMAVTNHFTHKDITASAAVMHSQHPCAIIVTNSWKQSSHHQLHLGGNVMHGQPMPGLAVHSLDADRLRTTLHRLLNVLRDSSATRGSSGKRGEKDTCPRQYPPLSTFRFQTNRQRQQLEGVQSKISPDPHWCTWQREGM
jgi:hypothetical protein